jgi:ElaA protein
LTVQWQTLSFTELSRENLYAILRLRQEVFVVEQQCVFLDLDNRDQAAIHMLCTDQGLLAAYQRCIAPDSSDSESLLGRIVVCPTRRHHKLGGELVKRGIEHNLRRWPGSDIRISAQAHLQNFYTSLGFNAEGSEYLEDNIPHRQMRYRSTITPPEFPAGK